MEKSAREAFLRGSVWGRGDLRERVSGAFNHGQGMEVLSWGRD